MLDWTDRHFRRFFREISRHTWLYTEMVNTGAVLYGDAARHLRFSEIEQPLALQLGGRQEGTGAMVPENPRLRRSPVERPGSVGRLARTGPHHAGKLDWPQ